MRSIAATYVQLLGDLRFVVLVLVAALALFFQKTKLGRAMGGKLKVYAGAEHPHGAQKPASLKLSA